MCTTDDYHCKNKTKERTPIGQTFSTMYISRFPAVLMGITLVLFAQNLFGQFGPGFGACADNNNTEPPYTVAQSTDPAYTVTQQGNQVPVFLNLNTAVIGPGDDFCIGNDPGADTEDGCGTFLFTGLDSGQADCGTEFCFSPRQGCGDALGNVCIFIEDPDIPGAWLKLGAPDGSVPNNEVCVVSPPGVDSFAITICRPGQGPVSVNDLLLTTPPTLDLGPDKTVCNTDVPTTIDLTVNEPPGQTGGTWEDGGGVIADPTSVPINGVVGDMFTFTYTYDASGDVGFACLVSDEIKYTITDVCCEFFATCNLSPTEQVIPGCDVSALPAPFTNPSDVFENITTIPCGTLVLTHNDVPTGTLCPDGLTVTRTYTLFDDLNNNQILDVGEESATCVQNFKIVDTTAPTASNPAPIDVQCVEDVPLPDITVVTDEADNCGTPTVAFVSDVSDNGSCPEIITRTYSVTDDCGNSINVTQTITIDDDMAPAPPTAPADESYSCATDVPAPGDLTATDNCSADITVTGVDTDNGGSGCAGDPLIITRTWTFTDDCNNSSSVSQTITVVDDVNPTASNPAPIDVQCVEDVPLPDITVVTDEADNCGTPTVVFVSDVSDNGSCPEIITRTYSVTDDCGNSINVTQTITIDDDMAPAPPTAPADESYSCATDVPAPGDLTATDNCSADITVTGVDTDNGGSGCAGDPLIITRTWTFTDDCNNSSSVSQTITVVDDVNPTASNPAPIDVQCVEDVPLPDITVVTDEADNCGTPTVAFVSDVSDNGSCPEIITRTYSVTDDCGNSINVTQTITIDDDMAPAPPTAPADESYSCATDVPAPGDLTATDNCSADITVTGVDTDNGGSGCAGDPLIITRTWTFTDDCNNSSSVSQTITVVDDVNPTASNPAPIDVQCVEDVPLPDITVVTDEADNCGTPTVAFVSDVSDNGSCPEIITRTYSVTDDCGNSINVTQTITIDDDMAPAPPTAPADESYSCATDVPAPGDLTATDNCSADITVTGVDTDNGGSGCAGDPLIITRTWTFTDDCNNSSSVSQTITVVDDVNPTASNPAPIDVQCVEDVPLPDITVVTDEADNCGTPTVAFVSDVSDNGSCPEIITRTYSVTDDCGNSINVTQTITIDDDMAPAPPTAPADESYSCATDVPAPGDLTATDNCSADITVTGVDTDNGGSGCAGDPLIITRTWNFTDDCNNSSSVSQMITVVDDVNPTASNPAPIDVQCVEDIPAPDISVVTDEADNCTANPVVAHVSDVSDGNTCPEVITRTYSVTDDCGNSINVTQTITIDDDIAPVATATADENYTCLADVPAPGDLTATDNCSDDITVTGVDSDNGGSGCVGDPLIITRTWTFTDDCNNSSSVSQMITVVDDVNPTASNPAPIGVQCVEDVPAPDISVVTDEADNCTANPVVAHVSDVSDGNTCPEVITRTYSVTDDCGNSINVTQTITIDDDMAPAPPTAPADESYSCATDVPAPGDLTATDNCSADITVTGVDTDNGGSGCAGDPLIITRTWTFTDDCNNSSSVSQTITVVDDVNPTASNPAPIGVQCVEDIPSPDISVVTDEADNCTANPVVAHVSDVSDGNTCPEVITRTYSVTDDCGNSINVTQTITIDDDIAPVATAPADENYTCLADVPAPGDLTATDNCSDDITVTGVDSDNGGSGCVGDPLIITRTWTFTDDCNNSSSVSQMITVVDDVNPTASNPAPIGVQCVEDIPSPDISVVTDEADNCTANPVVAHVSDVSDGNTCPEVITRTYSVTDDCGNSINVTQTITIDDDIAPVATAPADENYTCLADVPAPGDLTATDNCSDDITVTGVDSDNGGSGCVGDPLIITRTWTFTDDCNNSSSVSQMITVVDDVNPTASNPAPIGVQCVEDIPSPDISVVTDEADNCTANPVVAHVSDVSDGNTCPEVITRTYSVTDDCGNSINVTQTITIDDDIAPVATAPADENYTCLADVPAPGDLTATDNCSDDITVTGVDSDNGGSGCVGDPLIITRTWTFTDDCNNSSSVSQMITVVDDVNPTIDVAAADETVECDGAGNAADFAAWLASQGGAAASDVCGGVTWSNDSTGLSDDCGATGSETVTFTATDDCGNTVSTTATFTIEDVTPPTIDVEASDLTVECDGAGNTTELQAWLDSNGGTGMASDICSNVVWTHDFNGLTDDCGATGSALVTFTATDDCGHTVTTSATFTIEDTTAPTITVEASDLTVECDGAGNAAELNNWLNTIGITGEASDDCSGVTWTNDFTSLTDGCGETGSALVTFTATDDCGHTVTTSATFTIEDTTAPTITVEASDLTVECDGAGNAAELNNWLNTIGITGEASDDCSGVTWTNDFTSLTDGCGETGSALVTFTATDDCGHTVTTSATFTIEDTTAPTITVEASDLTVECDGAGNAAELNNWLNTIGITGEASDDCSGVTWTNDFTSLTDDCGETGSALVTFTATDDCGHTVTTSATFTIEDTTAPTITVEASDLTVECDGAGNAAELNNWLNTIGITGEASDDCSGVTWTNDFTSLTDGCGETGSALVTFTATDDCGHTVTTSATFTIEDTTAPTITVEASDLTVECDGAGNAAELNNWLNTIGITGEASDDCSGVTWTNDFNGLSDDCGETGSALVTFTATDDCGHTVTTSATFTIEDTTAPTITVEASDLTVECDGAGNAAELNNWLNTIGITGEASDDCSGVTWTNDFNGLSDDCGETGSALVTFTATDDCGHTVTTSATFTIEDTIPPAITCPADAKINCGGDDSPGVTGYPTATDACDEDSELVFDFTDSERESFCDAITRTWVAIDACGNVSDTCTQEISTCIDLSIVKTFDPAEVPQGTMQSFTIEVSNAVDQSDALDVSVTDMVDDSLAVTGVTVTSGSGDCSASAGQVIDCTVDIPAGESVIITVDYTAAPFLSGDPSPYGTQSGDDFRFVFVNGSVLEGSTDGGPVFLDGVDITADVMILPGLTRNDLIFDPPGTDPAFELHLSCSDPFTGGWGQSGGPVEGVDVNWQIAFFSIARYNSQGFFKSCGNVVNPFDVPNIATATGLDSAGTQTVSDDATVTIEPGITLDRLQTNGKRLTVRLTNFTGEDKVIEDISIDWPASNGNLKKIRLDEPVVWSGDVEPTSALLDATDPGWNGGTLLTGEAILRFDFANKSADSGYTIRVNFTDGTFLDIMQ